MTEQTFVYEGTDGKRVDVYLCECLEVTRSFAAGLLADGHVTVQGRVLAKNHVLKNGESICVCVPDPVDPAILPEDIPLDVVYEDDDLLVVNKPKGMVVHPAPGHYTGTLVNALLYHCHGSLSGINGVLRPGIVHRIDKDTSGLLLVAKSDKAHVGLAEQIKEHSLTRSYMTVVYGQLKEKQGTICAPIGRHPVKRKQMAVTASGSKEAVTHYRVLAESRDFSLVQCRLETGRTHQIRVHMAYIGHPVAGDTVYGPKKAITALQGQCLHACQIGFLHPVTGRYLEFSSELPRYFQTFLKECGLDESTDEGETAGGGCRRYPDQQ